MTDKRTLILPLTLIVVGVGWLLTELAVMPGVEWVWTLGLVALGVATLAVCGFDKLTVVVGPFFIAAGGLSVLRQTGQLPFNVEMPILMILLGLLLVIARMPFVPAPKWATEPEPADKPIN